MEDKFEWSPGLGAAPLYPMESYRCNFIYADGDGVSPAPTNLTHGVWGEENGSSVVGEREKPIPVVLEISWLSYTENKFYKGHFKLPYEKISTLFHRGYNSLDFEKEKGNVFKRHEYNNIVAGLAPGGVVVVWVNGGSSTVEIGRFQATETHIDMKDFAPSAWTHDQKTYTERKAGHDTAVTKNLAKNGIAFGLWDRYRERFNQRPFIKYDQAYPVETNSIYMSYFNGEGETIYDEKYQKNDYRSRARVKKMNLGWTDVHAGKSQDYGLDISFDEAEMFRAYKEAFGDNSEKEGQLLVEINRGNDRYRIFLQVGTLKIELVKQQGEIMFDNRNK